MTAKDLQTLASRLRGARAALIDMDGTLYDSMPNHARAWMRVAADMGANACEEEFFLHEGCTGAWMIDRLISRTYGRAATEAEKRDYYAAKARYFREMPPVEPMAGARRLVDALMDAGLVTVLVTGSGQASLLDRLETDFPGAFPPERRVTSASVVHGKPAPDPFLRGLELAGVGATEAVGIDNAPSGVTSAHAAGIVSIGVVTGPIPESELYRAGADFVFISMPECAKTLSGLL